MGYLSTQPCYETINNKRLGFTLLELIAVISILGLISMMVSLRYSSHIRYVREQGIPPRISFIYEQARQWAKTTTHPVELRVETGPQTGIWLTNHGSQLAPRFFPCPGLKAFRSLEKSTDQFIGLRIDPQGESPAFAIGYSTLSTTPPETWLVISGSTGNMLLAQTKEDVDKLVEGLQRVKPR